MLEITSNDKKAIENILCILDPGSFIEIGEKVEAGVVTGYGSIDGDLVYVFAQDDSIRGGSFGEKQANKLIRLYTAAIKSRAPVIGFLDCSGIRIEEGLDALNALADVYEIQAQASNQILQIMIKCRECIGSMETMAAFADVVISDGTEVREKVFNLIKRLPASTSGDIPVIESEDNLNRLCSSIDEKRNCRTAMLGELSDDGFLIEVNQEKGEEISNSFIALAGRTVGAIAAESGALISRDAAIKTSQFINLCSKFQIPLLNVIGGGGFEDSESANTIVKALVDSETMTVDLIPDNTCGSCYSVFSSKGKGRDYVFMWDEASVQLMNPLFAADILHPNLSLRDLGEKAKEYEKSSCSAEAMAAKGYVDKIIKPEESRKYLIGAFETLANVRR